MPIFRLKLKAEAEMAAETVVSADTEEEARKVAMDSIGDTLWRYDEVDPETIEIWSVEEIRAG